MRNLKSKIHNLNSRGMTFIEIIVVMVIVGTLAAIFIPRLEITTTAKATVEGAAFMVASDLHYAQECSMTYGLSKRVIFTSGSSTYTFLPASSLDPSGRLPSGVTVGSNYSVTFNSLGEPIIGGGGSVTISGSGQTKTITVLDYTGKVNIS